MCGIAGILSENSAFVSMPFIKKLTEAIKHRGPDGEGYWTDNNYVALGHRRLAITDLSDAAAQPMHFQERLTITYNGEIYNYNELRLELLKQGYVFSTLSDTEVILAAYDCYKEKCLQYFDGMFAIAIWDSVDKKLFLARDRFGEKPLYYYMESNIFMFASEMKSFWAVGIDKEPEEKMMINYLALGYVQNVSNKNATFYKNIFSLPPAHFAEIDFKEFKLSAKRYFDIDKEKIIKNGDFNIRQLLCGSVINRLEADVEAGLNLSGGLDSSIITSISSKFEPGIKTFSALFPGFEKDEKKYISLLSEKLRLTNFFTEPTAKKFISKFEKIVYHQEEPFSSSSIFAQYEVFELAALHNIKVVLDGQGADEIFAGYNKYIPWYLQEVLNRHKFKKFFSEKKHLTKNGFPLNWNFKNAIAAFLPAHAALALEKREFNKITGHHFINKELLNFAKGREWEGIHKPIITKLNDALYFNTMQNGLEELLRYADRNSMAHGVEVRLPFLQHELVNYVFSLPSNQKIQNGYTKFILRKSFEDILPSEICWRKDKTGFEPPQKQWMETKIVDDYVFAAKKKLVQQKILVPNVLNKKTNALPAYSADNFDWRYLCLAAIV